MFNCTSRRHYREAEIVRKRVAEEDRIQKWSNVQGYYKSCDLSNSRIAYWEGSGASSKTKTPEMCIIEERKQNLETRREQLKKMLQEEMLEWGRENGRIGGNGRERENWKNSPMMHNLTRGGVGNSGNFVTITGEKPIYQQCEEFESCCKKNNIEVDDSKLEYLMGNMKLDDEQLSKLDVEEADKFKKLLNLKKMFHNLSKIDCGSKPETLRYEQWKQMCLSIQNNLKKSVSFLQEMRSCVGAFQITIKFLDRLLEFEKCLQEKLKFESSEDRFVRLLEQTRREPNKKWFYGEISKWEEERRERMKTIEIVYGEFQVLVREWAERNHEKISGLFDSEDQSKLSK